MRGLPSIDVSLRPHRLIEYKLPPNLEIYLASVQSDLSYYLTFAVDARPFQRIHY